jgi:hypothetical protein
MLTENIRTTRADIYVTHALSVAACSRTVTVTVAPNLATPMVEKSLDLWVVPAWAWCMFAWMMLCGSMQLGHRCAKLHGWVAWMVLCGGSACLTEKSLALLGCVHACV